ncbi:MAG: DUF433 domain-containing protein [Candidatus Hydrogenedentes bacterium]|nr:DUF433 domain-containing protein [Candidatus Hydrogenedentota bacterium]
MVQAGRLDIFRNDDGNGGWRHRPNTILIDSEQLDSGEAMSDEFKKVAAREIDEFKQDYRLRFPEKDVNQIKDEDLLREVMNTVGKTGKLGEQVKCVVSVSMLTEGWDANTVTHILGVRAFGTQLLCEQVVGRSLRRRSYEPGADGLFEPEYAEVFGVPFSFLPCAGTNGASPPPKKVWRVRALPERAGARISFPRLTGYRYALPVDRLTAAFSEDSRYVLTTQELATWTESAPIVGEHSYTSLEDLRKEREQTVAFEIARLTLEKYFLDAEGGQQVHLFADLLGIAREWLRDQVRCHDNTFKQLLLITEFAHNAADRIYQAIAHSEAGEKRLLPLLRPYDTLGSTDYVDFDTTRPVYEANPDKCHLNYVVADTDSWEQKMAQVLEQMPQVLRYVKNHNLGFTVPYTINGEDRQYTPDFLVHVDTGNAPEEWLNLIIEVTGASRRDKEAKVATARNLWIPAVNNAGTFGRWDFIEIKDPWNARQELERYLDGMRNDTENIAKTPGVCGGRACIRGTRIPVWTVVKLQRMNYAPQDILRNFPSLRETDLVEAQVYYALHTQEIDRDINANEACV